MIKTRTHTLCIVGADEALRARIATLLDEQAHRFDSRWRSAERAAADLLLIDAESVYGHLDWLREKANGRLVAACVSRPEAHAGELCLPKPVLAADLASLLNAVAERLAAHVPVAAEPPPREAATPGPTTVAEPAAPAPASLLDLLEGPARAGERTRVAAAALPTLLLDPLDRTWRAEGSLKSLAAWCSRTLVAGEVRRLDDAEFETAAADLPAQPYARLVWLAHLLRGGGHLDAHLNPAARYKLAAWPQSEREFPKHFRIATAMLRQAGTPDEIAARSGALAGDVADFINAYHSIGYVEVEAQPIAEAAQRGLFARRRKSSTGS